MATIEQLRSMLPDGDKLSDAEVVKSVADTLKMDPQSVAKQLGMTTGEDRNAASAGLRVGWENLKGLGYSAGAALADVGGATGARDWLNKRQAATEAQAAIDGRQDLDKIEDVYDKPEKWGGYLAYQAGQQIPQMAGAIGAGLIVPEAVVPAALTRAAAFGPRALGMGGMRAALEGAEGYTAKKAAAKAAEEAGHTFARQVTGGAAFNEGQSLGSLYQAAQDDPNNDHKGLTALAMSPLYALSETLPEAGLAGRLGHGSGFTGNILTRMGKNAAMSGASGAMSETSQAMMENYAGNTDQSSEKGFSNILNSGVAGGIVEGMFGSVGGIRGHHAKENTNTNDVQQAFQDPAIAGTPVTQPATTAAAPVAAPVVNPTAPQTQQTQQDSTAPTAPTTPTAPVVNGGTTAVAQGTAAVDAENNRIAEAQKAQSLRDETMQTWNIADPENPSKGQFFGHALFGPAVNHFADAMQAATSKLTPVQVELAQAVATAHDDTGNKLISFSFNAADPMKTASKAVEGIGKVLTKFQIGDVANVEEAAARLNEQSKTVKGAALDQLNAIHSAITGGEDTVGWTEAQQPAKKDSKSAAPAPAPAAAPIPETMSLTQGAQGTSNVQTQSNPAAATTQGAAETTPSSPAAIQPAAVQPGPVAAPTTAAQSASTAGVAQAAEQQPAGAGPVAQGQSSTRQDDAVGHPAEQSQGQVTAGRLAWDEMDGSGTHYDHLTPQLKELWEKAVATGHATGEVQEHLAQQAGEFSQESKAAMILRSALDILLPPSNKMDAATAAKRREFIIRHFGGLQGTLPEIAKEMGITLNQAKSWSQETNKLRENPEKMLSALQQVAQHNNLTLDEIEALTKSFVLATDDAHAPSTNESTTSRSEEPVESDTHAFGAANSDETADAVDKRNDGLTERDDKSESVQEQYNPAETVNAKYMRLLDKQEKLEQAKQTAEDNGHYDMADSIQGQIDDINTQLAQLADDAKKHAETNSREVRNKAGATKEEPVEGHQESTPETTEEAPAAPVAEKPKKQKLTRVKKDGTKAAAPAEPQHTTAQEHYEALTKGFPVPAWASLDERTQKRIADLHDRGQLNLAGVNTILSAPTSTATESKGENKTETDNKVTQQVAALPESQQQRLEQHYGTQRSSPEFLAKVREDIANYVNKGAVAVAGAIRHIIKALSEGVLAMALVFNPAALPTANFAPQVQHTIVAHTTTTEKTHEVRAEVPTNAVGKMSESAQVVYESMAPVAKEGGKAFLIADKVNGMMHAFHADGSLLGQFSTLFGKDIGDKEKGNSLQGAPKITPAGRYTLQLVRDPEYKFGYIYQLVETKHDGSVIAVHAVYTGTPSENRVARLQSAQSADHRISFGCMNVANEDMANTLLPAANELNGGMIFVLPEESSAQAMFPAGKATVTEGKTTFSEESSPDDKLAGDNQDGQDRLPRNERPVGRSAPASTRRRSALDTFKSEYGNHVHPGVEWERLQAKADRAADELADQRKLAERYKQKMDAGSATHTPEFYSRLQEQVAHYEDLLAKANDDVALAREANQELASSGDNIAQRYVDEPVESRHGGEGTERAMPDDVDELPGDRHDLGANDASLAGKIIIEVPLEKVTARFTNVREAIELIRKGDFGYLLDKVGSWHVSKDGDVDFAGAYTLINGDHAILLNMHKLENMSVGSVYHVISHEIGHLADRSMDRRTGMVFSGLSMMKVSRDADGTVRGLGEVSKEICDFFNNEPAAHPINKLMAYPLSSQFDSASTATVQKEIFAQLWSLWRNPDIRDFLKSRLPLASAFIEASYAITNAQHTGTESHVTDAARRGSAIRAVLEALQGERSDTTESAASGLERSVVGNEDIRLPERAVAALPEALRAPVKSIWSNLFTAAKHGALSLAITQDVVDMASKYTAAAKDFLKAQYTRTGLRLAFERKVDDIISAHSKLDKPVQDAVNNFLYDSTLNAKWGFQPAWSTKAVHIDPAMKARFDALSPAARKVITDTLQHGHDALVAKQEAVKAAAAREFDALDAAATTDEDRAEVAKARRAFNVRYDALLKIDPGSPYAHLARHGDYLAVAKSQDYIDAERLAKTGDKDAERWLEKNQSSPLHYVVQFAATQGEADHIAAQLRGSQFAHVMSGEKLMEDSSIRGNNLTMAVARLKSMVAKGADAMDPQVHEATNRMLSQLYLQVAAEHSARKSDLARKNIAGADKNMMRNLATSGRADAHFISALATNHTVADAMTQMRADVNHSKEGRAVVNELLKRHAISMEYKAPGPLVTALKRTASTYFLATNPSFYLQQMLQTAVLTQPYLAGRLGYFNSGRHIRNAYADVAKLVKGLALDDHVNFNNAPADVRAMLQELVNQGKIDVGMESEARVMAEENGHVASALRKLGHVNNKIETINRATAAIAAYRGYIQRYGNNPARATEYAAEVVQNTHGNYDGFNTPRAFSGDFGRVMGQFRRFQIIQLSMLAKMIHGSFKGASPEERMVARKMLGFLTAHMAVLGGAMGVPFVSQAAWLLTKMFGPGDEPDDAEYQLRKLIGDKALADLLLRGVPSLVGAESLGRKLAMENVASVLPFTDVGKSPRDTVTKVLVGLMGPAASIGLKFADGYDMMSQGEYYKGLEQMLPNGVANAMKGARFASEGITQRNGDMVLKPEDVSMLDAAMQAVGLPSDTIADRSRNQQTLKEFDDFYAQRGKEIVGDYVKAFRSGDSAAMGDARQAFQELQDSRVRNGYTRQPVSTLFKAPMAAAKRERSEVGGLEYRKQNAGFARSLVGE